MEARTLLTYRWRCPSSGRMFVVVIDTIRAFSSDTLTSTVVPATTAPAAGEVMWTTAGEDGRGALLALVGMGFDVADGGLPQAARRSAMEAASEGTREAI